VEEELGTVLESNTEEVEESWVKTESFDADDEKDEEEEDLREMASHGTINGEKEERHSVEESFITEDAEEWG
jgi:hypothetical protein